MSGINQSVNQGMTVDPQLIANAKVAANYIARARFHVECLRPDGSVRWVEEMDNLVTNEGLDDVLDKYFLGSAWAAAWYVGLIDVASAAALKAGDNSAGITTDGSGANDWGETTEYTEGVRQTLTLGAVSGQSVDNSASKASFSINATITIHGAFLSTSNAKLGTTGILYAEAAFSSDRAALNGDTLNVTVTLTSASA